MSKFSSLTEDKYTLNDIFTKHYQFWLAMPLVCYLLVDFIHVAVFTFTIDTSNTPEAFIHFMKFGEIMGDYLISLVGSAFLIGGLFLLVALPSMISFKKESHLKCIGVDSIPSVFFAVFAILILVSSAYNRGGGVADFLGMNSRGDGIIHQILYFVVLFYPASKISSSKVKYNLLYLFLGTGLMLGIVEMWNRYVEKLSITPFHTVCSIFYNQNFYAYFLTMQIMLSVALCLFDSSKKRRIVAFCCFLLNTFILSINDTFGCFVACLVAFIFFIVGSSVKNGKFSLGALLLFLAFLAVNFIVGFWYPNYFTQIAGMFSDIGSIIEDSENADAAGTARWGLWKAAFGYIREKPFLGFGFGGIDERLELDTNQSRVHNEYLEYAAYYGIPAALCYIGGLISVYIKALRRRKNVDNATFCCLVAAFGYIGSAFFGNAMVFIVPFFFIILGLANSTSSGTNETAETEGKETSENSVPVEDVRDNIPGSFEEIPVRISESGGSGQITQ